MLNCISISHDIFVSNNKPGGQMGNNTKEEEDCIFVTVCESSSCYQVLDHVLLIVLINISACLKIIQQSLKFKP